MVDPFVVNRPGLPPILYVNPAYTVRFEDWTEEESQPLLQLLYAHAQKPEFGCRIRWRPGTLVFWDNHQTWHYATNDYPGERRIMHRIVIEGQSLEEGAAHAA